MAAAIGLVMVVRPAWRSLRTVVVPQVEKAAHELREALRDPARLSLSFLGALLMDLAYIAALFASVRAFHYLVTFAVAGAVYLTGTVVASAAPTPGGVGAVEAALIALLTATGVPSELAVLSRPDLPGGHVLVARAPGWLAFTLLTRRDVI